MRRSQLGILFYEKHWAIYEGWFWTPTTPRSRSSSVNAKAFRW